MFRTPTGRRAGAVAAMAGFIFALVILDLLMVTRSAAVAEIIRAELRDGIGPGLSVGEASITLGGNIELEDVRFSPGPLQIAEAPSAVIALDVMRGKPLSIDLPRLDVVFDPERISHLENWSPAEVEGEGDAALPLMRVHEGTVTIRHPIVMAEGKEIVFNIRDGEIIKRKGAPLRAYLGLQSDLLGDWKLQWVSSSKGFDARLFTDRFDFTGKLRDTASDLVRGHVDKFKPEGPAEIEVHLKLEGDGPLTVAVTVRPIGMSISYFNFPYRIHDCHGEMELYPDGVLVKHLTGKTDGGEVFISGRVDGYEYEGSIDLDLRISGIDINQRLLDAASDQLRQILLDFEAQGRVRVQGRIVKARGPDERIREPMRVDLLSGTARFKRFAYPIHDLRGTLYIDLPEVRVDRVGGMLQEAPMNATGRVKVLDDGDVALDLRFDAEGLRLDDVLRTALPETSQPVFDMFKPEGRANLTWKLKKEQGKEEVHSFIARLADASCLYEGVPLLLTGLTGLVSGTIGPDRVQIQWDSIRGDYRESELEVHGRFHQEGEREDVRVEVHGVGIPISDEVVSALPGNVRKAIVRSKLTGSANARVNFENVSNGKSESPRFTSELTFTRSALELDVPIREIEGKLYLTGTTQRDSDEMAIFGRFDFSHAKVYGKRLSPISGSITLFKDSLRLSNLLGTAYDGVVRGRFNANIETGEFTTSLYAGGVELRQMRQDTEGYQEKDLSGRISIDLPDVRGVLGNRSSIQGRGTMTIREGTLWSVPAFLKILSLDVTSVFDPKPKFEAAVIKFELKEERYRIRSMIFRSEEASLMGDGFVTFDWDMNVRLKVDTEPLGDFWLFKPINIVLGIFMTDWWGVHVTGSFDDPQIAWKPFPAEPK